MRKLPFLWVFLTLLLPLATRAQQTLTVADGTTTNQYVPMHGYYNDSRFRNEMIYPSRMLDEMNGGTITELTFYSQDASISWNSNLELRIDEVADTAFASGDAWKITSSASLVWTGTCSVSAGQWVITLDEPYTYAGGNLLISIKNTAAGSLCPHSNFYGLSTTGVNRCGRVQGGSNPETATTVSTLEAFLPKVTFTYTAGGLDICYRPKDFAATGITTNSTTLSWLDTSNHTVSYNLQIINGTDTTIVNNIVSPYTATGLSAGTHYTFALQADCGSGQSGWVSTSAYTLCDAVAHADLPFVENFASWSTGATASINPCWNRLGYYSTYLPYANSAIQADGTSGNVLYYYAGQNPGYVILPQFDYLSDLALGFWAKAGSVDRNNIVVGVMSDPTDTTTFTPLVAYDSISTSWTYYEINLSNFTLGSTDRLALRIVSLRSDGYYVHLDDFRVQVAPGCDRPEGIAIRNIGSDQAELVIADPTYTVGTTYSVELSDATTVTSLSATDTVFSISSLTPDTRYSLSVSRNCTDGTTTTPHTLAFRTECVTFADADLPYEQGFEEYTAGEKPSCWAFLNPTSSNGISTTRYKTGAKSLAIHGSTSNNVIAVLPTFESPVSQLQLSFSAQKTYNYGTVGLEVGYVTDPTDATTFVSVGQALPTTSNTWYDYEFTFDAVPASASHLAFHLLGSSDYVYVDDLSVRIAPSCAKPTSLAVRNITTTDAVLVIDDSTAGNDYTVLVYSATDTVYNDQATDTLVYLSGLSVNTPYTVSVVANCSDGTSHRAVTATFRSACGDIPTADLPWTDGFESYTGASSSGSTSRFVAPCWEVLNRYTADYPYVHANSSYSNYSHSGNQSLNIYSNATPATIVILPSFEEAPEMLQLDFWMRNNSAGIGVEAGVITDPTDPSTFVSVLSCVPASTSTYEHFDVSFTGHSYGRIALRYSGNSGTGSVYLDDLTVQALPDCTRPSSVTVSDLTPTSATINIEDANSVGYYSLVLGADSTTVSGNSLTIDTLSPNTAYTVVVRTLCSDGSATEARTLSFRTPCNAAAIPDTIDFESDVVEAAPSCWLPLNGNVLVRSNASNAHAGSNYLDFRGSLRNMIVLPLYEEEINTLQVRFWTRPESFTSANCGTFEVGYLTDLGDTSTFSPVVSYTYNEFTAYEEKEVSMASAPAGAHIAFLHKANSSSYYWYVDDVIVESISGCPSPASVAVSAIGSDEATFTVNDPNNYGNYHYAIYTNDTVLFAEADFSGESITVYSLTPNTTYRVDISSACSGENSNPVSATFHTQCVPLASTSLPYEMDFNNVAANAMPDCWSKLNLGGTSYTNYPYAYGTTNPDGTSGNALYFYTYGVNQHEYAIMPAVDDLSGLMVSFAAKGAASLAVTVGIMDDPTDTSTFTALQTIPMTSSSVWSNHEVSFDTYSGSGRNVAFRVTGSNSYSSLYIDDVALMAASSCERPQGATVRHITTTSATLHIEDSNLVNNYNILIITGNDTLTTTASDTVAYLTDLNPSTSYKVMVSAICSDGTVTSSATANFFTECEAIATFPYSEGFEAWATGANGVHHCWNRYYMSYSASTTSYPYASSSVTHAGSKALQMTSYYESDDYSYYDYYHYSAAFMPEFDTAINNLTLNFWYKAEPYYPSYVTSMWLAVGVSETTADTTTFTRLLTIRPTDTSWHEYELDLTGYTGNGTRITFVQYSEDGNSYIDDYGYIDDITVDIIGDCARPATVSVSAIDTTSALLSWTDIGGTGSYSIRWTENDSIIVNNDLSYLLTDLTPATFYTVSVRRICDDNSLTAARTITFQTSLVPVTSLPYSTGFETGDDAGWQFINNNPNHWTIGSAVASGGTQALYISNDGGISNAYNNGTACISFAARNFDLAEGEYALSFDWKASGESDYDFLRVFVCHDSIVPSPSMIPSNSITTSTPAGWQDVVGGKLNLQGANWQSVNSTFTIADAGFYKVVFMWRNDGSAGSNPPAAIDNVSLSQLACPAPTALVFDSVSATEASFSWTPGGEETSWIVRLDGGAWQTVNTTSYTFSGLTPATAYSVQVRALCSTTDTSFALLGNFTTECGSITAANLPWIENFDAISDFSNLQCWDRYTGLYSTTTTTTLTPSTSGWVFSTAGVLGGTNHLRVNVFGTTCNRWLVTPSFDLTAPAKLTFDYALTAYYSTGAINPANSVADDRFMVLVTTDNGNSWTPLATWDSTGAAFASIPNTGDSASLSLGAYIGQTIRIAFYVESTVSGGDNDIHVDNIAVSIDTAAPGLNYYTVSLATADATMGSVSPAGNTTVAENTTFTAIATANSGYRFVSWNDATGAPVSTANPYSFTVTANTSLTASFEATSTLVSVSVSADATMGSVLGAGTYNAGTQVTLTAVPNTGYHFVAWMDGSTEVSTANPYVFTATTDVALSAIFAADGTDPDYYTIVVNYDASRGTVTGAGTYLAGTQVTLTATSNPGYRFAGWSNGVADSVYTFVVEESLTLTANFAETVGIQPLTSDLQPNIYPNPAHTTATLSGLEPGATVTIVDLNGREVAEFKIQNSEFKIDVTSLASGAYFVRITGERQQAIRKLIVK